MSGIKGNFLTKENGWVYFNSIVIYVSVFGVPTSLTDSPIFIIITFGLLFVIYELSRLEKLQKILFHRLLIESEIRLKKKVPGYDYGKLGEDAKKEVDKIDKYFRQYARSFLGLMLVTIVEIVLVLTKVVDFVSVQMFLDQISYPLYLALFTIFVNVVIMYNHYSEIKTYMLKDINIVYEKYG